MRFALPLVLSLIPVAAFSQTVTLDSAFVSATSAQKAAALSGTRCWTRGKNAAADAAGMPARICLASLKLDGKTLSFSGTALLAGKAQTETLTGSRPLILAGDSKLATVFHWEAGKGEFDEESLVQVAFRAGADGVIEPGTVRIVAWHQCPERGCTYACGVTGVEFVPES